MQAMEASVGYEKPPRWGEPLKFMPVAFALSTIFWLWFVYVVYHGVPMLQIDADTEVDEDMRQRGAVQLQVFLVVTLLLLICYGRAFFTHPGEVPDEPAWQYTAPAPQQAVWTETKRDGKRRHCKWCGKYKPDRCHHCRPCGQCVLKMDHHCPWIYNCVGFWNYKYFFLLLFYSAVDCHLIMWTMWESLIDAIDDNADASTIFIVLFSETLACFIGIVISLFFCFHVWLMLKGMTTIEWCEKAMPKEEGGTKSFDVYDRGLAENIYIALGRNPLLWMLPIGGPDGDGLAFKSRPATENEDLATSMGPLLNQQSGGNPFATHKT